MKRFSSHPIGIQQGDTVLFSDFEHDGEMWTGTGPRERRQQVTFDEPFRDIPAVQVSVSLWDVDTASAVRAEVVAQNITRESFDVVFRTWADSRIARIRVAWMAIGSAAHDDDWELY